jgi:hypothetical protein
LIAEELKTVNCKLNKEIIQQIDGDLIELKNSMYTLLRKLNSVQNLFKNAELKDGDKITIFNIGDMGMVSENRCTFHSVTNTTYAQYIDAVKIIVTPKNKRKQYYQYIHENKNFLLYNGWLELPQTVLFDVSAHNGLICSKSKFGSCDVKQLDEIQKYFETQDIKPIIEHKRES